MINVRMCRCANVQMCGCANAQLGLKAVIIDYFLQIKKVG